jgi:hypothetical protein
MKIIDHQISSSVVAYVKAMPAKKYDIRAIWKQRNLQGRLKSQSKLYSWSAEKMTSNLTILKEHNNQGYEIFARPIDDSYVLLDNVARETLADIAAIKPCLLMETSPGNYQVWLRIKDMPENRDIQKAIWSALTVRFNADPGSAKPGQLGRLPGFVNQKPKYSPNNPVVKLHKFANRYSTIQVNELLTASPICNPVQPVFTTKNSTRKKSTGDRSKFDYAVVCSGITRGFSDAQISDYLLNYSDKARERGIEYIKITIKNARKQLGAA